MMRIYVGNLPHSMTEQELQDLFARFGDINSVSIVRDRFKGTSRGFGFVEMLESEAAQVAIADLNNKEVLGRKLRVSEALPRQEQPRQPRSPMGGGPRGGGSRGGFGDNRFGSSNRGGGGGSRHSW